MSFTKDKCHILHFGSNSPRYVYKFGNYSLIAVDSTDDLGLLREAASPGPSELYYSTQYVDYHFILLTLCIKYLGVIFAQ